MHLLTKNRAISWIILFHGLLFILIGESALNNNFPVLALPLLLVVEFTLANIWFWYGREISLVDRFTGLVTASGFILISIQVCACITGMHRRTDEARFFLLLAVTLALVVPACLVARFVVRRDFRLVTSPAADVPAVKVTRWFFRLVNLTTAVITIGICWLIEQQLGLVQYCVNRLERLDSLAEAFPLPNLVGIFALLVLASFLTFTLLSLNRWGFVVSWILSILGFVLVGIPVWRLGKMIYSTESRPVAGAVESGFLVAIGLMILAVRLTGNRLLQSEEQPFGYHEPGQRWWNRTGNILRPYSNLFALLLVGVAFFLTPHHASLVLMWRGGQQEELDVRVGRGGWADLRSLDEGELSDEIVQPFLKYNVFKEIRIGDCSNLSPEVIQLAFRQPNLDRLFLRAVPSDLNSTQLGSVPNLRSVYLQGPGVTSSLLRAFGGTQLFVSFDPQQGHFSDRNRGSTRKYYRPDPLRSRTFSPAISQLQLHSKSPGFDGLLVGDWLQRVEQQTLRYAGDPQRAAIQNRELSVWMDLVSVDSELFSEFAKIQVPSWCFITVHDDQVSLASHQFAQLNGNSHLHGLEFQEQLPKDHPHAVILRELEFLRLTEGISNGWVRWLGQQPKLHSLSLTLKESAAGFDEQSLLALRQMKSLRNLRLHGRISDNLLRQIVALDQIETLFINDVTITDAQLAQIAAMQSLRGFHIERILPSRVLRELIDDPQRIKRYFAHPVQLTDQGIFEFISQVPNTTIYQFLTPEWLRPLVGADGRVDSTGLVIWGSLRKHGYSLRSIARIYNTLRRHLVAFNKTTTFNWSELNEQSMDQLLKVVKPVVIKNFDVSQDEPKTAAIVLGPGIRDELLTSQFIPETLALIATGVTGEFIKNLDVNPKTTVVVAGEIPDPLEVVRAGLSKSMNLHLQQFSRQGNQFELAGDYETQFVESPNLIPGLNMEPFLGRVFGENPEVRILIGHYDPQHLMASLPTDLEVGVLAIDQSLLTESMFRWILANPHLRVLCLDSSLVALRQSPGNQQIPFSDLVPEAAESHKWDLIIPLLSQSRQLVIYTKFGFVSSQAVVLKNSRLENILPQLVAAYPNIKTIDAFGSVMTIHDDAEPLIHVERMELQNGMLEGSSRPLHWLAKRFPSLIGLQISGIQMEHWDLQGLRQLKQLRELNLTGCEVGDEELRGLEAMTQLQELSLSGTRITNDSLGVLGTLTGLRRLNVYQTRMDADAVVSLRTFLPRCKIYGAISLEH